MLKKKEKTIRQRIEELIDNYQIPKELHLKAIMDIMELIERAKSPEMFCPKCDTRMSIDLESKILHCFNCGNKKQLFQLDTFVNKPKSIAELKRKTEVKPDEIKPDKRLLDAIDQGEKTPVPSKKGKSIQDLANARGGGSEVTKEDDDFIKKTVPGAKDVRWV